MLVRPLLALRSAIAVNVSQRPLGPD